MRCHRSLLYSALAFVLFFVLFAHCSPLSLLDLSSPSPELPLDYIQSLQPLLQAPEDPDSHPLTARAPTDPPSESQPNPIANQYPNDVTGTFNSSLYVVPIPYAQARAIVPAKYGILTDQVKEVWKDYQNGLYPVRRLT